MTNDKIVVYFKQGTTSSFTWFSQLIFEFICGSFYNLVGAQSSLALSSGLERVALMFSFNMKNTGIGCGLRCILAKISATKTNLQQSKRTSHK